MYVGWCAVRTSGPEGVQVVTTTTTTTTHTAVNTDHLLISVSLCVVVIGPPVCSYSKHCLFARESYESYRVCVCVCVCVGADMVTFVLRVY